MDTSYFNVVKPQRGNIHGLIPQPLAKLFTMKERDTHSMQSTPSLFTRPNESLPYSLSKMSPSPLGSNFLSKVVKPLGRFPCLAI